MLTNLPTPSNAHQPTQHQLMPTTSFLTIQRNIVVLLKGFLRIYMSGVEHCGSSQGAATLVKMHIGLGDTAKLRKKLLHNKNTSRQWNTQHQVETASSTL